MSDHPLCNVEILANDPAAAGTFYAEVFGWQIQTDPVRDYPLFEPQRGPGGFRPSGGGNRGEGWRGLDLCLTDDIDATLAKAETLGAKKVRPTTAVPQGWFAVFADPAGNRIALYSDPTHP